MLFDTKVENMWFNYTQECLTRVKQHTYLSHGCNISSSRFQTLWDEELWLAGRSHDQGTQHLWSTSDTGLQKYKKTQLTTMLQMSKSEISRFFFFWSLTTKQNLNIRYALRLSERAKTWKII